MIIQVLRLEDSNQRGVYKAATVAWAHSEHDHRQPGPHSDGITDLDNEDHFGFKNAAQMREWFWNRKNDPIFRKHDIQVSTYAIDAKLVKRGRSQITFPLNLAKKVDRQPLENYP